MVVVIRAHSRGTCSQFPVDADCAPRTLSPAEGLEVYLLANKELTREVHSRAFWG